MERCEKKQTFKCNRKWEQNVVLLLKKHWNEGCLVYKRFKSRKGNSERKLEAWKEGTRKKNSGKEGTWKKCIISHQRQELKRRGQSNWSALSEKRQVDALPLTQWSFLMNVNSPISLFLLFDVWHTPWQQSNLTWQSCQPTLGHRSFLCNTQSLTKVNCWWKILFCGPTLPGLVWKEREREIVWRSFIVKKYTEKT